jgi:hypothetical protein
LRPFTPFPLHSQAGRAEVPHGYEEEIAKEVDQILESFGLDVELGKKMNGRSNVVACWNDRLDVDGSAVIFNDHSLFSYALCKMLTMASAPY